MDKFLAFSEAILILVISGVLIVFAVYYVRKWWQDNEGLRQHTANRARLNKVGIIHDEEIDPKEARRKNLEFLGVPSVQAGGHIQNVPNLKTEGQREEDQEVLVTARIVAYTRQGPVPADLTELTNGYLIVGVGNQKLILKKHDLTTREADELEKQRQDAVDRGDKTIEEFAGDSWNITGAFGTNVTRKDGERECSYIQVLSSHELMGQPGYKTTLPENLMDGAEHDYYDLRARNTRTDAILFDFYSGGSWNCFIGRLLSDDEAMMMKGI